MKLRAYVLFICASVFFGPGVSWALDSSSVPVPPVTQRQAPAPPPPAGSLWSEVGVRALVGMNGNARRVGDLITVRPLLRWTRVDRSGGEARGPIDLQGNRGVAEWTSHGVGLQTGPIESRDSVFGGPRPGSPQGRPSGQHHCQQHVGRGSNRVQWQRCGGRQTGSGNPPSRNGSCLAVLDPKGLSVTTE
jgi:hypothetical protein